MAAVTAVRSLPLRPYGRLLLPRVRTAPAPVSPGSAKVTGRGTGGAPSPCPASPVPDGCTPPPPFFPLPRFSPAQAAMSSFGGRWRGGKAALSALGLLAAAGGGGLALALSLRSPLAAGELEMHPPSFPWSHGGPLSALDHSR